MVTALAAFLVRTNRRDGLVYLHAGWVLALVAGFATWWLSTYVIQISGAGREVTEGVAALTAAAVLFFVGYWMHSKANARQWQAYIQARMARAVGGATLWSLAALSFVTVYREIFETVLFYQALWAQAAPAVHSMIVAGFLTAAALLGAVTWLVARYSVRLPLRLFFSSTGALLLVLAFIFTGKGVAALQEAGRLPESLLSLPRLEWLGLYPSVEGLSAQLLLLLAVAGLSLAGRHRSVRRAA